MISVAKNSGRSFANITYQRYVCLRHSPVVQACRLLSSDVDTTSSGTGSVTDIDQNMSDSEDAHIKPALLAVTPNVAPPKSVEIMPGKGPPPEPPIDCCMSGCANCVWIQHAEELTKYFAGDSKDKVKKALEQIENPGLRMFVQLELGLL